MHGDLSSYDVSNSELLHGASYAGTIELPVLQPTSYTPDTLIPFSRARASRRDLSSSCIHFYEHDTKFRCVWNNPHRYLPLFQKAGAVIGSDFSMYRNMTEAMQQWSCFQSRAISFWLQQNGVEVIPNVRFSDDRSWEYCFEGLPKHSVLRGCPQGTGSGRGLDFGFTADSRRVLSACDLLPTFLSCEDLTIGRSIGARALSYDVKDPKTGEIYRLAEGSTISDVEVFAGKGVRSKLRKQVVAGLVSRYGGKARNWQHVKGIGTIERDGTYQTAEIHWFQESSVGKCEFKVKRWP